MVGKTSINTAFSHLIVTTILQIRQKCSIVVTNGNSKTIGKDDKQE
jgi:hypothetical protein